MIHADTIEQYKVARALEDAFEPESIEQALLSPFEIIVKDRDEQRAVFYIDKDGNLQTRDVQANEAELQEIAAEHRKAWEEWPEGGIVRAWTDENGALCIEYRSGNWYHYRKTDSGLEWW